MPANPQAQVQAARLEAVRALDGVNAAVLSHSSEEALDDPNVRLQAALDWSLEQLALQRPEDPVEALAGLLRKYNVETRKAAMGISTANTRRIG